MKNKLSQKFITFLCWLLIFACFCSSARAQQKTPTAQPAALQQEVTKLKSQVKVLKDRVQVLSAKGKPNLPNQSEVSTGGVAILFGAFCALWAQNTRRNALFWFICGVFFNVITVLILLYKNSKSSRKTTR